jgi:hypothetical protein
MVQVIDATPDLFYHKEALGRIKTAYGLQSMRFIVILRNPVQRAISQYRMNIAKSKQKMHTDPDLVQVSRLYSFPDFQAGGHFAQQVESAMDRFEQCTAPLQDSSLTDIWNRCYSNRMQFANSLSIHSCVRYVGYGLYDHHYAKWLTVYPAHDFCIISSDFFVADKKASLSVVGAFLGLSEFDWQQGNFKWTHQDKVF